VLFLGAAAADEALPPPSPSLPPNAPVCISPDVCIQPNPELRVSVLSPPAGPLDGVTQVVVVGDGFRDFGSLMRCRFGAEEVPATLWQASGGYIDPFNHTHLACISPRAPTPMPQTVNVEITLNGEDFSSTGAVFRYYRDPSLVAVSPVRGSAFTPQYISITRSRASDSGEWDVPGEVATKHCRFDAIIQPDGKWQVPFRETVNASVLDGTELVCLTPRVSFVAPVRVDVSLNGQQFATGGPTFLYEDNWHSPDVSGSPPSARQGHAAVRVGPLVYVFGGEDGHIDGADGFVNDLYVLNLDTMTDFYPSATARDLTWQKLSLSTGGEPPSPRSHPSLCAWADSGLLLFGGMSSVNGNMHNSTFMFHIGRGMWEQLAVSGGPVSPRSGHAAVLCSLADGCAMVDGRPRMVVHGGWGVASCGGTEQCLVHNGDLLTLDLASMVWSTIVVNAEQPRPPSRKGHSATLVNGSKLLIFGGSAWVPDPSADNSFGFTTRHINDLWSIDLSGQDGYTWKPIYAIGDVPKPREGHEAILVARRYLVVIGGYGHTSGYCNDTHVLDTHLEPMVWTRPVLSGEMPRGRHGFAAVGLGDDEILTFGGMSLYGFENDLHVLQVGVGNTRHYPELASDRAPD